MIDRQREKFIAEMNRLKDAIARTKSECLRRDYKKALIRMSRDLREYDLYRSGK